MTNRLIVDRSQSAPVVLSADRTGARPRWSLRVGPVVLSFLLAAGFACSSAGSTDSAAQAAKCFAPGPKAAAPYLPSPRTDLERCFKKAMGDEKARRFILGATNAALADWFTRYASEIGQRLATTDHYPDAEVAGLPALRDGASQINELYRALAVGFPTRLGAAKVSWELRSAIQLCGADTALTLTSHHRLDLGDAGASYVAGDLAKRFEENYKYLEVHSTNGVSVTYALTKEDLQDGLAVALWADDRIRPYLMTPGHFSDAQGGLAANPPPTTRALGVPIDPPLEGPGHILRFPDLANPDRDDILVRWNSGPLDLVAGKGIDLLGLGRTLDDVEKMFANRK